MVHARNDLAGLDQEGLAGPGQRDAAFRALHQLHPQLLFQLLQLLAEGRLGDVAAYRRPSKMQLFGQGDEAAQSTSIHDLFIQKFD